MRLVLEGWLARLPGERRDGVAVRWLFLRLLALVYLAAFVSFWVQAEGLIGSQGIAPIARMVQAAHEQLGPSGWQQFPTVLWWDASDAAIQRLFAAGTVCSVLLFVGVAPVPMLVLLQILYLSAVRSGDVFMHFQWDFLLLETGLLAILCAPLSLVMRPSRERGPNVLFVWLLRWLIFRLMFSSGAVKLTSLDPTWADLTAMQYHYQTQPLPPWSAWFVYHLPPFAHRLESLATFVVELGVPFLVFGHRTARRAAFVGFAGLSGMILVTGNYGFFNWLTLALSLTVLDDGDLPAGLRRVITGDPATAPEVKPGRWRRLVALPVALLVFALSGQHLLSTLDLPVPGRKLWELNIQLSRYGLFNEYGLFRVMTTTRPEVVIEGSDDGSTWKPYGFRYKMGDLARRPGFVAPHMPRLDWQMWFAALAGSGEQLGWFQNLLMRLLQGSPPVLALLETNPFPEHPPRYVRATLHDYQFTSPAERSATGAWWKRRELGPFFPLATFRR